MPRPQWTHSVSDVPRRAPANHRDLPACTQVSGHLADGTWSGSAIPARALRGVPAHYLEKALRCDGCGGDDVRCMHLASNTGIS